MRRALSSLRLLARLPGALALLLLSSPSAATTQVTAPAGGGLAALSVTVDLKGGVVRAGGESIPIALDRALYPEEKDVVVEAIAIGHEKHVVHVRVPARSATGVAWEALLASGEREPIFSGLTGYARGEDGERTGAVVQLFPRDGGGHDVVVGELREDLRICGQAQTPLSPRALDGKTMKLRGATVQRLPQAQQDAAARTMAQPKGGPATAPLARLLVATGSSVPSGSGAALTDGDVATAWSEQRPGAGRGEFVVMRAPPEVPIARLAITIAPTKPAHGGASPKSFFLVSDDKTIAVHVPEDAWAHPGEAYEIALPEPLRTSCLALVLDESYASDATKPEVSVAELSAYSEFDVPGATLDKVAAALGEGEARAQAASAVLKRAGDAALAAAEAAFEKLDARGRALAVDVAIASGSCAASAPMLIRAMGDRDARVAHKGKDKLERCGKDATVGLVKSLRENASGRVHVAPLLAAVAPDAALDPLADVMGDGDAPARAAVRAAFGSAAKTIAKERLAAFVSDAKRSPDARLDLLRAAASRLPELATEANAAIAELLHGAPAMRVRYLVVAPVAELARAGDATATKLLGELMARDAEWPVRARAAEAAAAVPSMGDALGRAANDAEPRVREAAVRALAAAGAANATAVARERIAKDTWSFVRVAAIEAVTPLAPSADVDAAIGAALKDSATRVRVAAATALGARRAAAWGAQLRARVDDKDEELDVRVAAVRALGATCHSASLDRLTELAHAAASPAASDTEVQLAAAAIEALGQLHPADLAARLAPFGAKTVPPYARHLAKQALDAPPACR